MSSATSKWLIGCGIGCGAVLLLVVAAGAGSFFMLKSTIRDAERIEDGVDRITESFGRITEYTPDPDGAIRPERLETFLAVRESMAPARAEMEKVLAVLSRGKEKDVGFSPFVIFQMLRSGFRLIPQIMEFYDRRNEALLGAGMGLGEYCYIYAIAYYCWLGKSPADGPPFVVTDRDESDEDRDLDESEVREQRLEQTLRRLHDQILPMLRNQRARLEETAGRGDPDGWHEMLAAEIETVEADPYRLPWRDGLPAALERSLQPFRERLQESYSPLCNALESGIQGD